jgi:hypothetical protein
MEKKEMYESAEAFTAYATIEAGYFCLQQIQGGKGTLIQRTEASIEVLETILQNQNLVGIDSSKTQEAINACKFIIEKSKAV